MSSTFGRSARASFVVVALLPRVAPAGEPHHKAHATQANVAAKEQAAEQRAMMHQQAVLQHQAAEQRRVAEQSARARANSGVALAHRGGAGIHGGSARNQDHATGPMISSLHSVVNRLHQADHDYNGHRVQAIHQLDQAIRTLQPGSVARGTGLNGTGIAGRANSNLANQPTGTGNGNASRMPQAESDAHLRQAHQELMEVEAQMSRTTGTAAHHQQAHTHVQQALQHLNTALAAR